MFDYDDTAKRAVETLDEYDFTGVLKDLYGVSIYDVQDAMIQVSDQVSDAVHDLSSYELAEYLHVRYGMRLEEVVIRFLWWNNRYRRNTDAN